MPREEDDEEKGPALVTEKTMIFVNTAEAAVALAKALTEEGVQCAEYHKLALSREREENLEAFRRGDCNVLVCTDHAAR